MSESNIVEKRWVLREVPDEQVQALHDALKVHPVICRLLVRRGITTYEEAYLFFRPDLSHLHDPFLMKGMLYAVWRIERAIAKQEKILVYGDYDVDGTTSVALVYSFLREFYPDIDYYIPDRYLEGYGISTQGVDYARDNGFQLIIALDCGIRSVDKVTYAKDFGIDFIICDHHLPGDEIPQAVAVLDPKQPGCPYPYKELSGCGIGYKLVQAFALRNNIPDEVVNNLLDLLVVSIASDIVPITGENRVLAHFGLEKINHSPSMGLSSLIEHAGLTGKKLTITDLVFYLGPRINAAGRMDHGRNAVKLLLAESDEHAMRDAATLQDNNTTRKQLDKDITEEALGMIRNDAVMMARKSTVLYQPHWSKGVIGIVASRLIETYYKPTIVLTESHGMVAGSARSVSGYNVYDAINSCSDLLEQFGGHFYAAGLSLKKENLEAFIERFEQTVSSTITDEQLVPELAADAELLLSDITPGFYKILKQFAPSGPGNMRPVFWAKNCRVKGDARIVGENHLKLNVTQDGYQALSGIAFNLGQFYQVIAGNNANRPSFDILFNIEENEWQGNVSLQLNVKDIRVNG